MDPSKVAGKIVTCLRGVNGRVEKGGVVKAAGGVGMILANNAASGDELLADPHLLPASMVSYTDGLRLLKYINDSRSVAPASLWKHISCIHACMVRFGCLPIFTLKVRKQQLVGLSSKLVREFIIPKAPKDPWLENDRLIDRIVKNQSFRWGQILYQ